MPLPLLGILALLALACSPSQPEPLPTPATLTLAARGGEAEFDRSRPDDLATLRVELAAEFTGSVTPPEKTTLTASRLTLVGKGGMTSTGLGLDFLSGSQYVAALEVPAQGRVFWAQVTGLRNSAAATLCGDTLRAHVYLRASHCDCEVDATAELTPRCFLDNRGADLLAKTRGPATDRPCSSSVTVAGSTAVERYGWDARGRLEIVDGYSGDTWRTLTVYAYGENGLLATALRVDPTDSRIVLRQAWTFGADGALSGSSSDGWIDEATSDPDGSPEVETVYTRSASSWQVRRALLHTGGNEVVSLAYDLAAKSFQAAELGGATTTYAYEAAVTEPNLFVALPSLEKLYRLRVTGAQVGGQQVATWAWSGARLVSETRTSGGTSATADFAYTCP